MTFPKPASHPRSCRTCHGTGWQPGPNRYGHAHGEPVVYATVEPCTHIWHDDDPDDEPELLDADHPRAQAAFDAGYLHGQHELWVMSGGRAGLPPPQATMDIA